MHYVVTTISNATIINTNIGGCNHSFENEVENVQPLKNHNVLQTQDETEHASVIKNRIYIFGL